MSVQKGKPSKRALPSVPLLRSGSVDFINPSAQKSGTRVRPTATSSTPTTPEKVILRKTSAPAGVLRQQILRNSPLAARRRLLEQRRDSNSTSSSNDNSPHSSRRGSKENMPVIKDVEDENNKSAERKIARVLPMSPSLLTNEGITTTTTPTLKNSRDFQTPLCNEYKEEKFETPESSKPYSGTPRNFDTNKTPISTPYTPYQIPNIADEDSCSIIVAVRARPLSQR